MMSQFIMVALLENGHFFAEETDKNVMEAERYNRDDHTMPFHGLGDRKHDYNKQTVEK
jgi:hypothetical protein